MAVQVGWATDVGCVREVNEDAMLTQSPLFVVADGMGGHAAGEVAAAIALDHLAGLAGRADIEQDDVLAAIEKANDDILAGGSADRSKAGMGTTVSGVCLLTVGGSPHCLVFNVGDSRVYRFAAGALSQVTVDHSEVEELLADGRITRAEARVHPLRNVVTRSLGTRPAPVCDRWLLPAIEGDRFVVCSDGLSGEVEDADIAATLLAELDPQRAADALLNLAMRAGARDNVSVIVLGLPTIESGAAAGVTAPRRELRGAAHG